ncbi:MAG TPA: cell wall-binding repeat-containing protein, partial [Acidimicrobiales bacterium]|nr:cell wall-binding repeat-containing protein [Acidimicrobiales bacterium]
MYGAVAGITAFGALSGLAAQAASAAPTGNNLAGADRYQTAGNLNAAKFGSGGVGTVLLADAMPGTPPAGAGGHQSDALAVSGYAGLNKYGLLLTDNTNTVPANTMTALSSLKVKNIVAVGGSASITPQQIAQLTAAGYTVTQPFQGADRYATMQMVDSQFTAATVGKDPSGNPTAVLASGDYSHLVDALAAGGLAYKWKFPVILSPSGSSTLGSQAQQEITSLGIKHLIVVGGTASIPASQYTPNPSGVTSVDVFAGADRSATSRALEQAVVKTYGASTSKLAVAAGATYYGTTGTVQNDGADALSGAPYNGDFEALCVTNGPTNVGSAPQCVGDLGSSLTTVDWETGTANLPASQQSTILAGTSGGGTANTYSVSGGSLTASSGTAAAPTQGATTYTVSGLPTAAGTKANIALFPCQGTAQSGNGPTNGAPSTNSSGATTFTAPGGTTPTGGNAIGQGTSQSNPAPATAGFSSGNSTGSGGAPYSSTAYIASVNGVPTANG